MRQIEDVIRLGHVRRIEADRIVLEQGEARTGPEVLHVDCTALGLRNAPATPIFQPGRIVLQQVRHNTPPFNAALVGFVEAHRDDDTEKNQLCPPNPYASSIHDWPRMMSRTWRTERRWLSEPDVAAWLAESRLNLLRALPDHLAEPPVQMALQRYLTHVGAAIERLEQIDASSARRSGGAVGRVVGPSEAAVCQVFRDETVAFRNPTLYLRRTMRNGTVSFLSLPDLSGGSRA